MLVFIIMRTAKTYSVGKTMNSMIMQM
jgi:hypothetical protein